MRLGVFTGASPGRSESFARAVAGFGRDLAAAGVGVVYGGGRVGLMGALADGALGAGGEVIGVIPGSLVAAEIAHPGLTDLRIVNTMHERKALITDLADGLVALPGGAGTLDELFEAWTWQQLGLHRKPVALFNVARFWEPLLVALEQMSAAGFIRAADLASLIVSERTADLLAALRAFTPPESKWAGPSGVVPLA